MAATAVNVVNEILVQALSLKNRFSARDTEANFTRAKFPLFETRIAVL